ncbi:MAG: DUF1217 domain-containing protein [Paracoccus sp. (in: a-proteobacteria)]|nr:DUF1217 domain-containing protein [Paracoccus sp. (in: a-proteobacteria)]
MNIAGLIGQGGLGGWAVLQRTAPKQKELLAASGQVQANSAYFRAKIGKVTSAQDLVSDYRLLDVALKAHGLEADQQNRAFIRKVLEGGTEDKSLASRLSNKAYARLAETFGLANGEARPKFDDKFATRILQQYVEREFEIRVGEGDQNMRLALNAQRELAALAEKSGSARTKWFEILGSPPLRKVFEAAFGFNAQTYGRLPIDRQQAEFAKAAQKLFGSDDPKLFAEPAAREQLIRRFLTRAQIAEFAPTNRFSTALALLRPGG